MLYFTKLLLKEAKGVKTDYWNLVPTYIIRSTLQHVDQLSETEVSISHNTNTLATKIILKPILIY